MRIDVVLTPKDLQPAQLIDRAVVVFDVLRATTTMTAALEAGVAEIRIFDSLDAAQSAAAAQPGALLCGERACLRPPGFDLGNSPAAFDRQLHAGRTLFMSTTNGTRAIVAARAARRLVVGSLVNASAVARHLAAGGLDVLLLCAGTDGAPAMEDLLGAGAVIDALQQQATVRLETDLARIAAGLFVADRSDLFAALSHSTGGRNVIDNGLEADVAFAARLDLLHVVGVVEPGPLRVVRSGEDRLSERA